MPAGARATTLSCYKSLVGFGRVDHSCRHSCHRRRLVASFNGACLGDEHSGTDGHSESHGDDGSADGDDDVESMLRLMMVRLMTVSSAMVVTLLLAMMLITLMMAMMTRMMLLLVVSVSHDRTAMIRTRP